MMRRVRRIASIAAATLLLVCLPLGMTASGVETELFGYSAAAKGSAISFLYNQPTFGVPQEPTFELRKVHSAANLDSGPASHGLGSVVWPGDVAGNAGPGLLFEVVIFNPTQVDQINESCFGEDEKGEPRCIGLNAIKAGLSEQFKDQGAYPVRAEAFYPSPRDHDEKDVGAGTRMAAQAREDRAEGSSTTGGSGAGVISFGTIFSRSFTVVEKSQIISTSITRITDLDLFGAVQIDSMLATATATSNGVKATTSGVFEIAGMTIRDEEQKEQLKVSLDKTGLHVVRPDGKQEQDPAKALTEAIEEHLKPHGLSLTIGTPGGGVEGASAERTLTGLILHLDATGMTTLLEDKRFPEDLRNELKNLLKALRNPTGNQVIGPVFGEDGVLSPTVAGFIASFFQGDQTLDFVFGSVAVSTAAAPALPDIPIGDIGSPPLTSTPPLDGGLGNGGFGPAPSGNGQPGGFTTFGGTPVAVVGVPLAWLLVALAVAIAGSTRLRLFADRVTAAAPAARCLMEEK